MAISIQDINQLFTTHGSEQYGGEDVSQLQHALQCAHLAEQAGASPELITAALLHDLGHLLTGSDKDLNLAVDDVHQYAVIPFLRGLFPPAVIEPIRLHVDAKRYLCATDPSYWSTLSLTSRKTLELQGGAFTGDSALAFAARDFAYDAVALRRWDDLAKNPSAHTPDWAHFVEIMEGCRLQPFVPAAATA